LRLLLYTHELVLDSGELYADFLGIHDGQHLEGLRQWVKVRPLVETGSLKFALLRPPAQGISGDIERDITAISSLLDTPLLPKINIHYSDTRPRTARERARDERAIRRSDLRTFYGQLAVACRLAAEHKVHTLARRPIDEKIISLLLQRPMIDNRQIIVQKLAALKVPAMATNDIDFLVKPRTSDADFGEWRTRLGAALTYIGELGEDDASLDQAAAIVYGELSDGLSKVEKATKKSQALQAAKGG
jgi:hypothetical protein